MLSYDTFSVDDLGDVSIKHAREFEEGDAPQRAKVTLRVTVDVFERGYAENYALIRALKLALAKPNAVLLWRNSDTGEDYVNQTVTSVSDDVPEEWGSYHQAINLVFTYYEALVTTDQNLPLTFLKTGSTVQLNFSNVKKWSERTNITRLTPLRAQRKDARGTLSIEGLILGDTTLPLETRRATLAAELQKFRRELNSSEGQLTFGPGGQMFSGVVRVDEFNADVDHAICAIPFSIKANYTLFPDEDNYAFVELALEERDDFSGMTSLTATGKIEADSEARARAKLTAILAAALAQYGYDKGQQVELDTTPHTADGPDGPVFTELSFTAAWRKWRASNQVATFKRTGGSEPVPFGNVSKWKDGYKAERFDPRHPQRKLATGSVVATGTLAADGSMPLKDRRKQLLRMQRALKAEVNCPEGTLKFGDWSQVVKVEDFEAEINQAETGIDWSLTASFVLFPGAATAEFTAAEKDNFSGETGLEVAGKITAPTEASARTKLASIVAAVVKSYGYDKGQQLALDVTPTTVDGDTDGQSFTELSFTTAWRKWRASNQVATFKRTGGNEPVPFGNVSKWKDGYKAERFDPRHPQRKLATGSVVATGTLAADGSLPLKDRRKQLLRMQRALKAEVNCPEGTLKFGDWSQVVKVEDFEAEINQAETGIDWSLTASFVLFPGAATAEFTAAEKDNFSGETGLEVAGKITAPTEASARTKLASIIAAVVKSYGYDKGQQLALDVTPTTVDGDTDGQSFTELSFTAAWRKWRASNQVATFKKTGGNEPVPFGNVTKWKDGYKAERFDPRHPQRKLATGTIMATGTLAGNMAQPLAARRTALLALQRALKAEVNCPDGELKYGDWTRTVKVEDFEAEINQAETGIDWTLTCSYLLFPVDAYATADVTAEEKDGMTGELFLTIAGKVQANTEAAARAKLTATLAVFLKQYSYEQGQMLELNITPSFGDADADGLTFLELSFSGQWRKWRASNQVAHFLKTGGKTPVPFGNVRTWEGGYKATRFDEQRSQRRHAGGTITASGTWVVDPGMKLEDRRKALLAMERAMHTEVNGADGTLTFGDWSQVVRVDELIARINQAETGVDWSFGASYSIFPNEGGYATASFTAEVRDDVESGDTFLVFAGEISAPNAALARAKLDLLRTGVLKIYGFKTSQRQRGATGIAAISANGDATAGIPEGLETQGDLTDSSFLRLPFNEEYRSRATGSVVSSSVTISSRDDTASGLLLTSFAGSVTAGGPNADAALALALARALVLGGNKELTIDPSAFLKASTLAIEKRQTRLDNAEEFVRLTFTYEYQSKLLAGRAYLEMNTAVLADTFGPDSESVSGFVVARDFATAQTFYLAQVRTAYAGRLLRNETTTQNQLVTESVGGNRKQELRLDFAFSVHRDKPPGKVGARYSLNIARDMLNLTKRSRVSGSVFAFNTAAADGFLNTLLAGFVLGANLKSDRTEDHETDGTTDAFIKLDFTEEYDDVLRGVAGILECKVSENVTYSATRYAVQDLPFNANGGGGISIPQPAGITPGMRTVRGSVSAATLAVAEAWAWRQRALLTGDADGGFYPQPPQLDRDYEFVPRTDGIATGESANVRLYRVGFSFSEILPNYPVPN